MKHHRYKTSGKRGFFDEQFRKERLTAIGNPLEAISRVEHVFGFMEQSMNGLFIRSVGISRATGIIGLINLTYNLFRYEQVLRLA